MESIELCEDDLVAQKSKLHPNHFLNMQVKIKLTFAFTNAVSEKDLARKVEICKDILGMQY